MRKVKIDNFFLYIILIFIAQITFMGNEFFREKQTIILPIFFLFLSIIFLLIVVKIGFNRSVLRIIIYFLILELLYIVNYNSEFNWIINQFLYLIIIYVFSSIEWQKNQILILSIFSIIMIAFFCFLSFHFFENNLLISIPYMEKSPNANGIAIWIFLMSYFPLLYVLNYLNKYKKISFSILLSIILISVLNFNTRSVMLSYSVLLLVYYFWPMITKDIKIYKIFFLSLSIFIVLFVLFSIVMTDNNNLISLLNEYSYNLTGKYLFSSRNQIWSIIYKYIQQKPIFGYGSGIHYSNFVISDEFTSHNLYLEITLQLGVVGLVTLFSILYSIFLYFYNNHLDNRVRLGASFFTAIMIMQVVELYLLQTSVLLGLFSWMVIGCSMSFAMRNEGENV